MARTKADSYNKAAVKAPRKVSVLTGGQASNVKAGSTSKGTGNPYCPRPKPTWQLSMDKFFPKHGEPLVLKSVRKKKRVKKPEETAVASDEMVEGFCSVDESGSNNAVPNKSADDVDSENAGEVDRETADPSKKVHM